MAIHQRLASSGFLTALVDTLPACSFAMAYGSAVFRQRGYSATDATTASPMVDIVLGVTDSAAWHRENMERNPSHYSALPRRLGPSTVARVQGLGAGTWFNTLLPVPEAVAKGVGGSPNQQFKYGVIGLDTLADDLRNWRSLYIAGRMHKPIVTIKAPERLVQLTRSNLNAAASAALLQLPEVFTAVELFMAISNLSYSGDFRMVLGENPLKVFNIVTANQVHFGDLYAPVLQELGVSVAGPGSVSPACAGALGLPSTTLRQSFEGPARARLVAALPSWLQARAGQAVGVLQSGRAAHRAPAAQGGADPVAAALSVLSPVQQVQVFRSSLGPAIAFVVFQSSAAQGFKGLLSAGAGKSKEYMAQKLAKQKVPFFR